ncbi:AAA family ATPase [Halorussus salilacus]|uniref:AAA family ATPase n=1 Tax=Halorussus salilacus TaxID=2953750 RepID=UPI00209D9D53|nr:AAA family ATPase [Halorussus salilacus]USZ67357.1 AAA family ATPase [Halorussus salilacus]
MTDSLVVVCGLPGVGKTTVAETIADRVDGRLLRTDVVRKEILTDPDYTEEESRMVYDELFGRARATIEGGDSVVLDGTFQDEERREKAASLSEVLDAEFRLVKVECDVGVVKKRIRSREGDESDADFEVHEMYRETFDPLARDHVTVDNSDGLESTLRQVDEHFPTSATAVGDASV